MNSIENDQSRQIEECWRLPANEVDQFGRSYTTVVKESHPIWTQMIDQHVQLRRGATKSTSNCSTRSREKVHVDRGALEIATGIGLRESGCPIWTARSGQAFSVCDAAQGTNHAHWSEGGTKMNTPSGIRQHKWERMTQRKWRPRHGGRTQSTANSTMFQRISEDELGVAEEELETAGVILEDYQLLGTQPSCVMVRFVFPHHWPPENCLLGVTIRPVRYILSHTYRLLTISKKLLDETRLNHLIKENINKKRF